MSNIYYLFIILFIILFFIDICLFIVLLRRNTKTKDDFLVSMAIIDRTIDDYISLILTPKINDLKKNHNLDKDSQINSISSYKTKINNLIPSSTMEVIKLFPKHIKKKIYNWFSPNSLALFISHEIKNKIEI